ncbi:MAG: hypothetical protein SFZ02_04970 [bacterium]|nr:hypothetical protein [bacterium]
MSDIWEFNRTLTNRLMNINLVNLEFGRQLMKNKNPFWRGFGTQAVAWAVINIGIALVGKFGTNKLIDTLDNPYDEAIMRGETRKLRRILLINTPLNWLYMLGGYNWAKRANDTYQKGNGWGIVLQGFILFCFDSTHSIIVSRLKR